MLFRRLVLLNSVVLVVLALILVRLNLSITHDLVENETYATLETAMDTGMKTLSDQFDGARNLSLELCVAEPVQTALKQARTGEADIAAALRSTVRTAKEAARYFPSCTADIYAVSPEGALLALDLNRAEGGLLQAGGDWTAQLLQSGGRYLWDYYFNDYGSYIRVSRLVYDQDDWTEAIGAVSVRINTEYLRPVLTSIWLGSHGKAYLVESDGNLLFPYTSHLTLPQDLLESAGSATRTTEEGDVLFVRPLASNSFKLVGVVENLEILEKMAAQRRLVLITAAAALALSVLVTMLVSYRISNPIKRLAKAMKRVEHGDFDIFLEPPPGRGEIVDLYRNFNDMLRIREDLIDEIYGAKVREKEAELLSLQAQINPHFLYNTLDSISWMAMRYDAEDIEEMVSDLSSMLRYSLNNGFNILSVREELQQIRSYIKIQQVRFAGLFEVEYDVDESALDCQMIKLLLQPLVENSLLHGFESIDYVGTLIIQIKEREGQLRFSVINDGNLIDLDKIQASLHPSADVKPPSYGLSNVNDRLKKYYGPGCTLTYRVSGIYSIASFTIPAQRRREDHA